MANKWQTTFTSHRPQVTAAVQAAIDRTLEICGGKAETYAKKECPVDTGRLRASITHQRSTAEVNTEIIGTNVTYAPYVELGHNQEVGRYVPAIGKRLVASHVDGKPYIKPSVENHAQEYKNILSTELKKIK